MSTGMPRLAKKRAEVDFTAEAKSDGGKYVVLCNNVNHYIHITIHITTHTSL